MVTSPSGLGVVVIGGYNFTENKNSNVLLDLKDFSKEWVPLDQTLQLARAGHIAIPIPNDGTIPNLDDLTIPNTNEVTTQQHGRKRKVTNQLVPHSKWRHDGFV